MRWGYARVSSTSQSLAIQIEALNGAVCERIVSEKVSASTIIGREELAMLLNFVREGDELFVTRLDRLARSLGDLINIVRLLEERKCTLHVIQQPIETKTAAGRMFLMMLGCFAQFENEVRRERQLEGIGKAKAAKKYLGSTRGPSFDRAEIWEMYHFRNMKIGRIAKKLGCSTTTVWRAVTQERERLISIGQLEPKAPPPAEPQFTLNGVDYHGVPKKGAGNVYYHQEPRKDGSVRLIPLVPKYPRTA